MSSFKQFIKRYIFIIIPLLIVGLAALLIVRTLLAPRPQMPTAQARVTLYEIKSTEVRNSYEVIGVLEANMRVELLARVSGFLEKKTFSEGSEVKEGDALFQIEQEQYKAAYDAALGNYNSAQAQLTQAQLNFQRISDLYTKRSSPKSDYDNAKATLDMAQAAVTSTAALLEQARLNLEYTVVKAPFDGRMSDSPFSQGAYIGPTSGVLATIVKTDPLDVILGIPDRLMADLRFGSEDSPLPKGRTDSLIARVKINGIHIYEREGKISYISPLVDGNTATIKVKASFPNPDDQLIPGETVSIILEDSLPRKAILVPKNTVMQSATVGSFVYEAAPLDPNDPAKGLVAKVKPVKRGLEFPEGLEIIEGLQDGDKIINLGLMAGGAMLREGMPLTVVDDYVPVAQQNKADGDLDQETDDTELEGGGGGDN
jgi:membrane fusion protein (multidrug efflux system)